MALIMYQILLESMHKKIICVHVLSTSVFCAKKSSYKKKTKLIKPGSASYGAISFKFGL